MLERRSTHVEGVTPLPTLWRSPPVVADSPVHPHLRHSQLYLVDHVYSPRLNIEIIPPFDFCI